MTDFATLGIRIDSSQAKQATSDLDKLTDAGADAEKAVAGVGNAGKKAATGLIETGKAAKESAKSIDDYVKKLEQTAKTNGLGAREAKLYELAVQGASKAQLQAADSAMKMNEGYERGVEIGRKIRVGLIATAAAAVALGGATVVAFNKITESIAKYQELSEKTGETASNIASLQTASDLSGVSLDTVAAASVRLTSALSKTDDESKLVGKGIKALGLNFDEFKKLSPAAQLDAVAGAMAGFKDGAEKSAAAVAIFGRGAAELLPFLNDLADGGERQLRLSDEQIKAADDFTKAQARLKTEITQIAQVLVADSIPAITALTEIVKQAVLNTDSLSRAAGDLGSNNSVGAFAESAGRSLAGLLDYLRTTKSEFQVLTDLVSSYGRSAASLSLQPVDDFKKKYGLNAFFVKTQQAEGEKAGRTFVQAYNDQLAGAKRTAFAANDPRRVDIGANGRPVDGRPTVGSVNTDKAARGGKSTAGQEAKAQLALDLDDIRKAQDALSNTIANGEKLLEARRSANLITEAEYWKQKRVFLQQNESAQEAALEKELARLRQEQLTGKEKIDNDRKILDAQSKLAKVRENAAANLEILGIKEADALDKIKIKFEEAQKSAQQYVDTIARANQRDLDGMGRGAQQREIGARRNQRDDQLLNRSDQLSSQLRAGQITKEEFDKYLAIEKDAHSRALAEDESYWTKKLELQKDWRVGASEALQNYIDDVDNASKRAEKLITDGLGGLTDSITDAIMGDGKVSFEELGKTISKQLLKGIVEQQITKPIAEWLQGSIKDPESIFGKIFGGLTSNKGTGENWLGGLLGTGGGAAAATGAASASAAQASLAVSAAGATTAITALASAAAAAAASMGGSSIGSSLGGLFSSGGGGFGTGADFGSMDFGQFFAEGGYTGDGGKYQPAGVVHAGEYVVNAESTKRLGLSFLERLNMRGYADGGFVGSVVGGSLGASSGDTNNTSKLEVHNHFAAGTNSETVDQAALKFYRVMQKAQRNT